MRSKRRQQIDFRQNHQACLVGELGRISIGANAVLDLSIRAAAGEFDDREPTVEIQKWYRQAPVSDAPWHPAGHFRLNRESVTELRRLLGQVEAMLQVLEGSSARKGVRRGGRA